MRFFFAIIIGFIFLFFQMIYQKYIDIFHLDLMTLLVLFTAFQFPFIRSLLSAVVLGFLVETFSFYQHGVFIIPYLIVVVIISYIKNFIFSESYLSQAFWIFLIFNFLFFLNPTSGPLFSYKILDYQISSLVNAVFSMPLFLILDHLLDLWLAYFNRRRLKIDEADFYQTQKKDSLI